MCAYAGDGGTMRKLCDPPGLSERCVPGCSGRWTGAMRPGEMRRMLEKQEARLETKPYNEVVLDPTPCAEQPEQAIEAIFFTAGTVCRADKRCYEYSRQVAEAFAEVTGARVPLVEMDVNNWGAPFREVPW